LIAPGQPHLRANVTPDEILKYSPKKIDVINLEKDEFETIEIRTCCARPATSIRNCASSSRSSTATASGSRSARASTPNRKRSCSPSTD
jgi:hypothetical protein